MWMKWRRSDDSINGPAFAFAAGKTLFSRFHLKPRDRLDQNFWCKRALLCHPYCVGSSVHLVLSKPVLFRIGGGMGMRPSRDDASFIAPVRVTCPEALGITSSAADHRKDRRPF